jgi:hypothetical protein
MSEAGADVAGFALLACLGPAAQLARDNRAGQRRGSDQAVTFVMMFSTAGPACMALWWNRRMFAAPSRPQYRSR